MQLILIRHAEAINYETRTVRSDDLRYLTSEGRVTARRFFGQMSQETVSPDRIFSSPLIRAVQTAEIYSSSINFSGDIEIVNELRPDRAPASVISLIEINLSLNCLALVGHEPMMGILVNMICGNKFNGRPFRKCGKAIIEYNAQEQSGNLLSYTDPKSAEMNK